MFGLFDDIFDFDHDGKLDGFEKAAEAAVVMDFIESDTQYEENVDEDEERLQTLRDEIEAEGLDIDELEFMDEDDRRDVLEDAGLDPDDYDELFF